MNMSAMLALGLFVFGLDTIPYQSFQRSRTWNHASNARVGRRAASQFTGPGDDTITLAGTLYPELTGGKLSLALVSYMADKGKAWPLIEGTGDYYGLFTITSIDETKSYFFQDGSARKIEFSIVLARVDDETPDMLGEITPALMAML